MLHRMRRNLRAMRAIDGSRRQIRERNLPNPARKFASGVRSNVEATIMTTARNVLSPVASVQNNVVTWPDKLPDQRTSCLVNQRPFFHSDDLKTGCCLCGILFF